MPATQQDLAVADEVKAYLTSELQEVEAQIAAAERAMAAKEAAATNAAAQRAKGRIELEKARKEAKADKKQLRWLAGARRNGGLGAAARSRLPPPQAHRC